MAGESSSLADLIVGNLDIVSEALEEGSSVVLGEGSTGIPRWPVL